MSELPSKVRYCAEPGCQVRMSSLDKDSHLLCPSHTGWCCSMDQRCDVCRSWSKQQMVAYMALQVSKARKKASREKQRVLKSAGGPVVKGSAHFLGSSDDSFEETAGKNVSCSVAGEQFSQQDYNLPPRVGSAPPMISSLSQVSAVRPL